MTLAVGKVAGLLVSSPTRRVPTFLGSEKGEGGGVPELGFSLVTDLDPGSGPFTPGTFWVESERLGLWLVLSARRRQERDAQGAWAGPDSGAKSLDSPPWSHFLHLSSGKVISAATRGLVMLCLAHGSYQKWSPFMIKARP